AGTPPFRVGGALVEPLAPLVTFRDAALAAPLDGEINDESLVFRLSLDRFAILFTGDSGFVTEARLLRDPRRLACTVLKAAHHGSRYSSSIPFIKAAHPRFALISAGYNNSFHLPSAITLADLQKLGAAVYRTDLDGTIELDVDRQSGGVAVRKLTRMIDSP
ncbi:MAG: DNA internalization-related competence protein ComEC/Rec2, partial [Geobacter sp.]|nr:DNA internalization-related competence protein ComEC/Rec2 [Geobacter sp.]